MPITKVQKEAMLTELIDKMKQAKAVVFADYHGLSVKDMNQLRDTLRAQGVSIKVAKKTLLRIAAKEAGFTEELDEKVLEGTVAAAFSMEDELAAAKLLREFGKKNENLALRGALFEGRVLSVAETLALASLPGREELLAKLVYVLKSPISGFHGVLHNTISGFVRALNAIKDQREQTA